MLEIGMELHINKHTKDDDDVVTTSANDDNDNMIVIKRVVEIFELLKN
jgi:hypothetical protein